MNYVNNLNEDQLGKSHWEKYHLYYLIFGSLVLTTLMILISNFGINRKIDKLFGKIYFFSDSDFGSKIDGYLLRLKSESFPNYVKERVKGEIEKIKKSFGGQTKETKEEYIEQVMSFPWHQVSPENDNLKEIERKLDQGHHGMEKVKKSIIKYLAAKKQAKKKLGKIICLVGPAGVGKTSIAESIAKALGRPFEKISLGGVHNEAEIRGHRNTYISAKPGIIIQACQRAGVKNPVIVADEIEKMGKSEHHGDPAAAFLEILDPEQNAKFRDHYIELPVDLSQVMFICTANQIENISAPLRDRMEIIEIPSYTKNDKQTIAKEHLIPKLLKKYNLTKEQLTFEDSAIKEIIDNYTLEAGVRDLERKIVEILSEFSRKKMQEGLEKEKITSTNVQEYLGKPIVPDLSSEVDYEKPGIANGLGVYNEEIGGSVLPIEVICLPGKGKTIITGNLKETMEQSAVNALSYVRDNIKKFAIKDPFNSAVDFDFKKIDIHINVPKSGIPKNGPSAGVAFASAIISAFKGKKVPRDIGMTGEINLSGGVDEIGRLKEKIYAARQRGLKKVFVPIKNYEKDWEDIPSEIKDDGNFKITWVKNYQEIYDALF